MSYSPGGPCPTCRKPMSERLKAKLAPRIPEHFGPNRRAALEESQAGYCCICDLPIPLRTDGKRRGKYTCGKRECARRWADLCTMDRRARKGSVSVAP